MNRGRLGAVFYKELLHIARDPRSLFIIFWLPVLMMFIFGYAIDLNLKEVQMAVCDLDRSMESREVLARLKGSGYFVVTGEFDNPSERRGLQSVLIDNPSETEELLQSGIAQMVIIFPREFSRLVGQGRLAKVGVIIDGSNSNTASLIQGYVDNFFGAYNLGAGPVSGVRIKPLVLYNPEMKSSNFIVPGLAALIMMMLGALLTSVAIAREKETGTLEQMLVSPIRSPEVVLGKVTPYLILAGLIAGMVIAVGHYLFSVPIRGTLFDLGITSLIYLLTALSLGLLISAVVKTQRVAMMLSLFATVLPTVMLSGFIFPIESMPLPLRLLARVLPATHYLVIIRGIMLKGNNIAQLTHECLALAIIAAVLLLFAMKKFSLKLEEG